MEEILMKQKVLLTLLTLMILVSGIWSEGMYVNAEDLGEDIDYSYLLTDDALIGYAEAYIC